MPVRGTWNFEVVSRTLVRLVNCLSVFWLLSVVIVSAAHPADYRHKSVVAVLVGFFRRDVPMFYHELTNVYTQGALFYFLVIEI